ncbi:MAG TPA: hypothetical protein PLI18_18985, partial [Pirellulaceae bacterium]|nr:hypothetical protein [Pirellulaceae bacterium]
MIDLALDRELRSTTAQRKVAPQSLDMIGDRFPHNNAKLLSDRTFSALRTKTSRSNDVKLPHLDMAPRDNEAPLSPWRHRHVEVVVARRRVGISTSGGESRCPRNGNARTSTDSVDVRASIDGGRSSLGRTRVDRSA